MSSLNLKQTDEVTLTTLSEAETKQASKNILANVQSIFDAFVALKKSHTEEVKKRELAEDKLEVAEEKLEVAEEKLAELQEALIRYVDGGLIGGDFVEEARDILKGE